MDDIEKNDDNDERKCDVFQCDQSPLCTFTVHQYSADLGHGSSRLNTSLLLLTSVNESIYLMPEAISTKTVISIRLVTGSVAMKWIFLGGSLALYIE